MKIRRCRDCNEYKYIQSDGLCRSCYSGMIDRSSEYNLSYDPRNLVSGRKSHQLVLGMIGSGKTVGNKIEIAEILRQNDNAEVYIIDPLDTYENFVDEFDGQSITVGMQGSFNIFNFNGSNIKNDLAAKQRRVYDLIYRCYENVGFSIGPTKSQLIKVLIEKVYREKGITPGTTTVPNPPSYSDLISLVQKCQNNPNLVASSKTTAKQRKKIKSHLSDVEDELNRIDKHFDLSVSTKLKLSGDRLTHFGLSNLSADQRKIKCHNLFNEIWERATDNLKDTMIYIDNSYDFLNSPVKIPSLMHCLRTGRARNTTISLTTQRSTDILNNNNTKEAIKLIGAVRIHRLDEVSNRIANVYDLSKNQVSYIKNAKIGSGSSKGEILRRGSSSDSFSEESIDVDRSLIKDIC